MTLTILCLTFNLPRQPSISQIKMILNGTYAALLVPFIKDFREALNEAGRKTVVNIAVETVKRSKALLEEAGDLPKDLPTVCLSICLALLYS